MSESYKEIPSSEGDIIEREKNNDWYQTMQSSILAERQSNLDEVRKKLYRIDFDDGGKIELFSVDIAELLQMIREAGSSDEYSVEIPVRNKRIKQFIKEIMVSQDYYRLINLVADAFEDDLSKHFIGKRDGGEDDYRLIVYNNYNKK